MLPAAPPPVVELTPEPVERRKKLAIVAAATAIVLALLAPIGIEAHVVVRDEAHLWELASSARGTRQDWERYVAFADESRDGLRGAIASALTSVRVRAPLAAENVLVASAEHANLDADDAALCAIREAHPDTRGGDLAAVLLRSRFETRLEGFASRALTNGARIETRDALVRAARDDDPCHPLGMLTITRTIDASADLEHTLPRQDDDVRDERWARELSDELEDALGIPLAQGDEGGPLALTISSTLRAYGRFVTHRGATVSGLALEGALGIYARGRPPRPLGHPDLVVPFTIVPATSPALAIAQATSADDLDAVYTRMLAELDADLVARVRLELGLGHTAASRTSSVCDDFDPLAFSGVVHGDTREGSEQDMGTCSLEYAEQTDEEGYDDGWEEAPPANREMRYRMVVAERARVAIQTETRDERALVVYVQTSCETSTELACREYALEETFEPGVYSVVVDDTHGGSGRFDVLARVRSDAASVAACRDATSITSGTTVQGDTTHASDALQNDYGGVGSPEHVYAIDVDESARLRCTITADFAAMIDLRDDCMSEPRTSARENETFYTALARGRYFVVVDGVTHDAHGTYGLTCEIASAAGEPFDVETFHSPRVLDTFRAPSEAHGSCGSTNGPERTVRVEVDVPSHLHFASTGLPTTLYAMDGAREIACHTDTLDLDVVPGSYDLVVDSEASSFGPRTITLTQTAIDLAIDPMPR